MWVSINKLNKIEKELEELKKWQLDINQKMATLDSQISEFIKKNIIPQSLNAEQENRLKDLELWQAKLHSLMIEKTPANKEKLAKNYFWMRGKV